MQYLKPVKCHVCGWSNAIIFHDPKYNGFRGNCQKCGNNWPES